MLNESPSDPFKEAILKLNTLQSSAANIERVKREKNATCHLQIAQTVRIAERAGITLDMIDELSVIHVSGTKGKGSTCAYCESILRHHGYKTGFFSSPHLLEVRERIRINGKPLSRDDFSKYFFQCYQQLEDSKAAYEGEMPTYFRFLTIMALDVFIKEKVDVAIMEVGIGGEYDSTNIVRSPVVCGVTNLGLDHVKILGKTIEQIAWHKAGIFKRGVPAVTVPQPDGCLQVMKDRSAERGNPVYMIPSYSSYEWGVAGPAPLGIAGDMQRVNASLALQLCHLWLQNHKLEKSKRLGLYSAYTGNHIPIIENANEFKVTGEARAGLESCKWPGRNQKLERPGLTYYIDGAHTAASIQQCVRWFLSQSEEEAKLKPSVARVLMFNLTETGDREPEPLLRYLVECEFHCAVFCPNIVSVAQQDRRADLCNYRVTTATKFSKVLWNRNTWLKLTADYKQKQSKHSTIYSLVQGSTDTPKNTTAGVSVLNGTGRQNKKSNNIANAISATVTPNESSGIIIKGKSMQHKTAKRNGSSGIIAEEMRTTDKTATQNGGFPEAEEVQHHSISSTYPPTKLQGMDLLPPNDACDIKEVKKATENPSGEAFGDPDHALMFNSIEETVQWLSQGKRDPEFCKMEERTSYLVPKIIQEAEHLQVLCLGSLHLVGGLIGLLQPDINDA